MAWDQGELGQMGVGTGRVVGSDGEWLGSGWGEIWMGWDQDGVGKG